MRVDTTGKVSLDHIYTQPDPRAYFGTLRGLDYFIPELAKPHFAALIEQYRQVRGVPVPTVLDVGCSYGINAALLGHGLTMGDLYARYGGDGARSRTREALLARDRELAGAAAARRVRFLGLDASDQALAYAVEAGFLDGAVHADLEDEDPDERQRAQLAATDLVISTGCLGYVTERTIARIVQAQDGAHDGAPPWMAHFVLRMFPFDAVAETLAAAGYETVRREGLFRQRRFATAEERELVLTRLREVGVDPAGLETGGWLYAELYVSRPRA